jgi:2-(1,2-epoxy-1,2-dihydrophenyl)acetyl-CoA isomerase
MREELGEVVRHAAEDGAVRAVVITGAGRAFCAGADVVRMRDLVAGEDWNTLEALLETGAAVVRTIDGLGKPVLAAVNGVAAGGGANLALACDIRIAARSASIGQTFCRIGLSPDWGGTYFLPRLAGLGRAMELALTGDMLPADEAVRIGLFNRTVDDERVVSDTLSLAERIAARPPQAIALTKQALRGAYALTLPQALDVERANQLRLIKTPEAREAIRAFLETRHAASNERERGSS